MAKKPSYIGLLNAIANGERGGHELFKAWRGSTSDEKLKETLNMVAVREMEHSWAFEKRLSELGFALIEKKKDPKLAKQIKLLKSSASDEEKFASFGIRATQSSKSKQSSERPDGLLQVLADQSIDPQTGALLGRFICEERDTGVKLQQAFKAMQRRQEKKPQKSRARKKAA